MSSQHGDPAPGSRSLCFPKCTSAGAGGSGSAQKDPYAGKQKKKKAPMADLGPEEEEIVPDENIYSLGVDKWRNMRRENPYRFRQRTYKGGDRRFWTNSQYAFWEDFYNDKECLRQGLIVVPKVLNVSHFNRYITTDFRYIDEALKKLGVFELVCLSEQIFPDLVRQFFATVFFHSDKDRTITWMTGTEAIFCIF